ncbi:MAG: LLM class F420-dependent oxidoreductase [Deltaproteobacteria bacterium]|nr:LLM class F420-dependent oxidoreductase [Deltaproteobacteria bacterium]MBW2393964.1 LLM class F420-dependent oxidoreductase [Deltaproteobacteria bacterium]
MKLGAVLPTCEIGNDPLAIRDFAQAAEELGYAHLLIYDHVLGAEHADRDPKLAGPYTENDPFHEPFVLYGYLAAVTERIELATGVIILPQRQTALVAKQAAEIDLLSGGRFRLGVGTGWNWVEYEALGVPYEERGARLEEQVELLRRLWTEPVVSFEGRFHTVLRAGLLPRPKRSIPIWFGGMSKPAVKRAARIGDGLTFGAPNAFMLRLARLLREELEAAGRQHASFGCETIVNFASGPEAWHQAHGAWQEVGLTHLSMRAMSTGVQMMGEPDPGFTSPRQHIDALETFAKEMK